jgi:hypothetical protein
MPGCDSGDFLLCTTEWVTAWVTLVDSTGAPVDSATVTATIRRSGRVIVYPTPQGFGFRVGDYVFLTDADRRQLRSSGDAVIVTGTKSNAAASGNYVYANGGCHIEKVSGPDTLQLQ